MDDLADQHRVPCRDGMPPLTGDELRRHAARLPDWQLAGEHHLERHFGCPDFAQALAFVNAIGAIAEQEGHHPDLELAWGRVGVKIWTHQLDGLSVNDFVLAAKIDRAFGAQG